MEINHNSDHLKKKKKNQEFYPIKNCSVPAGRAVWHAKTEEVVPPTETGFPCGSTLGKLDLWRSDPVQSGSDRGTDKPTVHQGENRQT